MRKMLDKPDETRILEIGYTNKNGVVEVVDITNRSFMKIRTVYASGGTVELSGIYYEDMPMFIKACQEAYEEMTKQRKETANA